MQVLLLLLLLQDNSPQAHLQAKSLVLEKLPCTWEVSTENGGKVFAVIHRFGALKVF